MFPRTEPLSAQDVGKVRHRKSADGSHQRGPDQRVDAEIGVLFSQFKGRDVGEFKVLWGNGEE
jgi:hypothetical protein